jgi:phosphate starvation-inducible PhoH-like protein
MLMAFRRYSVRVRSSLENLAKTQNQTQYVKLLRNNNVKIVLATGPAGTGKTMIGCSYGIHELVNKNTNKIVITRPTISMSEDYGYLPGKIDEKLHHWLVPIYDSFGTQIPITKLKEYMQSGKIEIAPLGFIRGRTFHNSWMIVDEAQNIDCNQMKTLLTRIGQNTKMVLTGDLEQCDLKGVQSGLVFFLEKLKSYRSDHEMIQHVELTEDDILRSDVVKSVLDIYHSDNTYIEDNEYEY